MSKGLTMLEAIKNSKGYEFADNSHGELCRLVPIEEAQKQDKQLKALEIIKYNNVRIDWLYNSENANDYNENLNQNDLCLELTQEDYDLLKEVLL